MKSRKKKRPVLCRKEVDKNISMFHTRGEITIPVSSEKWDILEQPSRDVYQRQRKHLDGMLHRLGLHHH